MTTTGTTISSLMECPACGMIVTANVTVSTDTEGVEIDGGLLLGSALCDGCGKRLRMSVRVRSADQ